MDSWQENSNSNLCRKKSTSKIDAFYIEKFPKWERPDIDKHGFSGSLW